MKRSMFGETVYFGIAVLLASLAITSLVDVRTVKAQRDCGSISCAPNLNFICKENKCTSCGGGSWCQ